jgi:hypothetical protein
MNIGKTGIGLIVLVLALIANIIVYATRPFGDNFYIVADVMVGILSLSAVVLGVYAYRLHGFKSLQGKALLFMAIGSFFWFLGEFGWMVYEVVLGMDAPIASLADAAWFLGYPFFAAGIYYAWKITRAPLTRNRKTIITLSILAVITVMLSYLVWPIVTDPEIELAEKIVSAGYVICDMALIAGLFVLIISMIGGRLAKPWIIIAAALTMTALADITYSYFISTYEAGDFIDLLWNFDYLLTAFGFFYYRQSFQDQMKKAK